MPAKLSLKAKLLFMNVATLVALVLLFAVLLIGERQQLMADRQEKLKNLVETAHSLVGSYEQRVRNGQLTQDDAQRAALAALQGLRYGDSEYFRVNDYKAVVLMHPIKPELNGKDLSGLKDTKGKALFTEFSATAKTQGSGFVDYLWPKPGTSEPIPKLSYVKGFQAWGWVIGTGIYIDDVDAAFRQSVLRLLLWGLLIGGGITLGLVLLSRHILWRAWQGWRKVPLVLVVERR